MMYWPARADALLLARIPYEGDNKRRKYSWVCAMCGKSNASDEVDVDHVIPCGQFLGPDDEQDFIYRFFFGRLQVLCKDPCHKLKTKQDKKK